MRILSNQTTNLLNQNSLAKVLNVSHIAMENYLYVLRKSFHIGTILPFYRNPDKELRKMPKVFFFDLGLRNAALRNFNTIDFRQDVGNLYENFIFRKFMDRVDLDNIKFWRTQQQNEVDFIWEGKYTYEVKFNITNFKYSKYKKFLNLYPEIDFNVIYHLGESQDTEKIKFLKL